MRHRWVVGVVAGLATVAVSATAAAKPLDRGEFRNEFDGVVEDFCEVEGLTVEFHAVVEGRFHVNTHGRDGLVYFAENTRVTNTLTNMDNGNFVREHRVVLGKDLSVTDNGDGTLTVVQLSTGNATVYNSAARRSVATPARSGSSSWSITPGRQRIPPMTSFSPRPLSRDRRGAAMTSVRSSFQPSGNDAPPGGVRDR